MTLEAKVISERECCARLRRPRRATSEGHSRYLWSVTLGEFTMTRKDRVALYGRVGLILASSAVVGGVIAEPLIRNVWPTRLIVAHR